MTAQLTVHVFAFDGNSNTIAGDSKSRLVE
jgi:hypothetical protein